MGKWYNYYMKNTQVQLNCMICGEPFMRKRSHVREFYYCSKPCSDIGKEKRGYSSISERIGEDIAEYLQREYVDKLRSCRSIAKEIFGTEKSSSSVGRWLKICGIEPRHGSEAVKTQWIDNDERRALSARQIVENKTPEVLRKLHMKMKTAEYRKKQSVSKTGEKNGMFGVTGPNSPKWNPERTHEQRVQERKTGKDKAWRLAVFERDKFTCQFCGDARGGNLVAHHVNSYSKHKELRHDPSNGITLCEGCHKDYHSAYGWDNATAEKFKLFMQKTTIA
jgi:hypothetical protein